MEKQLNLSESSTQLISREEVIGRFSFMFNKVTPRNVRLYGLYRDEVKELFNFVFDKEMEKLKLSDDGTHQLSLARENVFKRTQDYVFRVIAEKYSDEYVYVEVDCVTEIINDVAFAFNVQDPRVSIILKSLVNMTLNRIRLQVESNNLGVIQEHFSDSGTRVDVSPLVLVELRYDKEMIDAIHKLSSIVDGLKITVENTLTLNDLFKELVGDDK